MKLARISIRTTARIKGILKDLRTEAKMNETAYIEHLIEQASISK